MLKFIGAGTVVVLLVVGAFLVGRDHFMEALDVERLDAEELSPQLALVQSHVEGEIFVVTEGAESIRLGLVEVSLYKFADIERYLQGREADVKPRIDQASQKLTQAFGEFERLSDSWDESIKSDQTGLEARLENLEIFNSMQGALGNLTPLSHERDYYYSGSFFLEGLPAPASSIRTNSDGQFSIELPSPETYFLSATSSRQTLSGIERYAWLIPIDGRDTALPKVILSNHNLFDPRSSGFLQDDSGDAP